MIDRRSLLLGSLAAAVTGCAVATLTPQEVAETERLGSFEHVRGRPGVVIGVPHGTPDVGTLDAGHVIRERLGVSGVFVTGFWDAKTRHRINVNRDTEEIIGEHSEVLKQWRSPRAAHINARYHALVKEAAQGPLRAFYEIHSNHRARYTDSVEVSTLGVSRAEAARLKEAFLASLERIERGVPRLAIHVAPVDQVGFNYGHSSTISEFSDKGCVIENPGRIFGHRPWRLAYAACLADAIARAGWS
jgi:hypothetical protein